jgi:hypothetical protein
MMLHPARQKMLRLVKPWRIDKAWADPIPSCSGDTRYGVTMFIERIIYLFLEKPVANTDVVVHEDDNLVATSFRLEDKIVATRQSFGVVFEELKTIDTKSLERAVKISLFLKASRARNY